MQVRILGAHQGESRDLRFISILVDTHIAIDAGGLTSSLSLEEQHQLDAVLITHRHYDHVKDLPMLAHNLWETKSLHIYCTADTRIALQAHIFNDILWPSMSQPSEQYRPIVWSDVGPGKELTLLDHYRVLPMTMPHTVPTVGYLIERDGKRIFYTADTRAEEAPAWIQLKPDLLIIETTMSNDFDTEAARFAHMTPMALGQELRAFHSANGYYPRTVCVHINPRHDAQVRIELARLSEEMGADIQAGFEGMVIDV